MAISRLIIDTSAYAAFKRGHPEVIDVIQGARSILIPSVVLGELLAGFEAGKNRQKNRAELKEFQKSSRVGLVWVTDETAERYAHIYAYLRKAGKPVPTNDLWIASSTMEHGAVLLTLDANFMKMPQIAVTHFTREGL